MRSILRALFDGARLRCPRCHHGHLFETGFEMRRDCPVCGTPFERASGEITGAIAINFTVSMLIAFIGGGLLAFYTELPLLVLFTLSSLVLIAIPIALYRASRGVWVSVLYMTGANAEGD